MAFCVNCGNNIEKGSKFCKGCGKATETIKGKSSEVKTMMCPQCGAVMNSFLGKCRFCGVEFWGLSASKDVKEFTQKLSMAENETERLNLIKTYPIPNTKKDILEYMILAASNIGYSELQSREKNDDKEEYEEAWLAKFIQGYQKAKLVYEDDSDFEKVKEIYNDTLVRKENADSARRIKKIVVLATKNCGTVCGVIALLVAVFLNVADKNSSFLELIAIILLIISAHSLKRRKVDDVEFGIAAASGLLTLVFALFLDNSAMFELGGCIILLMTVINFCRKRGRN